MRLILLVVLINLCLCFDARTASYEGHRGCRDHFQFYRTGTVLIDYFKAKGSSPEWELHIGGDMISFSSSAPGFEKFIAPHTEPVRAMDGHAKKYEVQTESGIMSIVIMQGSCQVSDSREGFSYKVDVSIRRGIDATFTTFSGCGVYITDYRLQDIWTLEEIKGKVIRDEEIFGERPRLEIKANTNAFSGFAGCNTMSGRIFSERNLLRFTDIVLTKLTCDDMPLESEMINALKFSTEYKIDNNRLFLSSPGHIMLVFRKTD